MKELKLFWIVGRGPEPENLYEPFQAAAETIVKAMNAYRCKYPEAEITQVKYEGVVYIP